MARAAILAIAALLLCRDLDAPFNGWHSLNDALYTQAARNHLRYGIGYTGLHDTYIASPPLPPQRYLHHPPLLSVFVAGSLALFGDHEWSARLVPILATLGSTALLTTILWRVGSPLLGLVSGLFFATLPLTAYFGRMVDHVALVEFFSLLMVHGYLQWTGAYRPAGDSRRGALAWAAGTVLGIGSGWAVVLPAALLWCWHALRLRGGARRAPLVWLTVVPALAAGAVVLHILAGSGWDLGMLPELVRSRSLAGQGGQQGWLPWLALQWTYLTCNFTWPGAIAAIVAAPLLLVGLRRGGARGGWWPLSGPAGGVAVLCGLQGLLWVVLFKNQSWFHDYWQFHLGPYVALSLAALVLEVCRRLGPSAPRLAGLLAAALLLAPMPFAAASLDFYQRHQLVDPEYLAALSALRRLVPPGAPIFSSHRPRDASETWQGRTYRWPHAVIAYYADRPVYFSRDLDEVRMNAPGCAAFVLRRMDQPWARNLEAALSASFPSVPLGENHLIFLLKAPPGRQAARP